MSSRTIKLTLAQALVEYLCAQKTKIDGENLPLFAGVWANFGTWQCACHSEYG